MDKVSEDLGKVLSKYLEKLLQNGYNRFADLLLGILVGLLIAFFYNKFVGNKALKYSYEQTIKAKDDYIKTLKVLVSEKLSEIEVDPKHQAFFRNFINMFK
jgi:hypothetical protein